MPNMPQLPCHTSGGINVVMIMAKTKAPDGGATEAWSRRNKSTTWAGKVVKSPLRTNIPTSKSGPLPNLNYPKLNQIEFIGHHSNNQRHPATDLSFPHQKQAMSTVTSKRHLHELRAKGTNHSEELPLKKSTGA